MSLKRGAALVAILIGAIAAAWAGWRSRYPAEVEQALSTSLLQCLPCPPPEIRREVQQLPCSPSAPTTVDYRGREATQIVCRYTGNRVMGYVWVKADGSISFESTSYFTAAGDWSCYTVLGDSRTDLK